ncbi:HIT family protein [Spartinivicinus ruber]|uniref:hypothetical protein n=1 Tax=Spartinivicinus ruber TaxID=2683272 RepID=UPI0013D31137|nr:hypothetical protein [Spartinivicinus ruber]
MPIVIGGDSTVSKTPLTDPAVKNSFGQNIAEVTNNSVEIPLSNYQYKQGSCDDTYLIMARESAIKAKNAAADDRVYPKALEYYDLAQLHSKPQLKFVPTSKAVKKYNNPEVAMLNQANFAKQVSLYDTLKTSSGVPGFIDAFFKGEPSGRTEGFSLHPEQFVGTRFDPKLGGFIISPNPSNIPEIGQTYTAIPEMLLDNTRSTTGFGLVAFWVPPNQYERYPVFQQLFPDTPIPSDAPAIEPTATIENRQKRNNDQELNTEYQQRTGNRFLSIPLHLSEAHIPLLEDLKATAISHLFDVYRCDEKREKVNIYSHAPIYAMQTCGLHFHIRVNEGNHPLETDLRNLSVDEIISQLKSAGKITKFPMTSSGKVITQNPILKPKTYADNGVDFERAPNPWKTPATKSANLAFINTNRAAELHERRMTNKTPYEITAKAAKKYDKDSIALVPRENIKKRLQGYNSNFALPKFIHNFFVESNNIKSRTLDAHPEQFAATSFQPKIGGMIIMPNPSYTPGKKEFFDNPTQAKFGPGGFGCVAYLVPSDLYEHTSVFSKLFTHQEQSEQVATLNRETAAEYKARTGNDVVSTVSHLRKEHLSLLEEMKTLAISHLKTVYHVNESDKIDLYFHSPVYGDKTAGLHLHLRVNQGVHPGENDTQRLDLDKVISILKDENIADEQIEDAIIDTAKRTTSDKVFSMSPIWNKAQFENHDASFETLMNPWKRPFS